ncbi:sarcosine oxidase subunit gamma [Lutimaribacter sp. EGI FJ00015]|uniref:Sarcosine oxidase subunit gamma n=1 Tax=Lutimaribacter degradans TaxID=2945989 RepID=A0ACC5ZST6_9RHOB|nr:sarcosine oxidase subunit gamma family protein [Lutimaribacter sp. EGI FJ00013]MCM2561238.1 sarcosine oxidase subunit gamma [Lutimaribacter sp. EGI FJ00013]MCO0611813.1 sarcosine oxidase subunit gamma [Lutimaribacter sp. EGI FJ00015]MCO0635066.1 sarcosine oxidase subunit gamma [Lutimaribacter sp. EGI FJ00014]
MSEAQSALRGTWHKGLVTVAEAGLQGMITLRGQTGEAGFADAVKQATGLDLPDTRTIVAADKRAIAWMSPDEWLLMCPYEDAHDMVAGLRAALAGRHHLVENVSDARAMFTLDGDDATLREVLAKLAPVDLHPERFGPGEMRRTRFAQVPGAFWLTAPGAARVVCFRSVAQYMYDLLCVASSEGSAVGYFKP